MHKKLIPLPILKARLRQWRFALPGVPVTRHGKPDHRDWHRLSPYRKDNPCQWN